MKKSLYFIAIVVITSFIIFISDINAQIVTGKLIDENNNGLAEVSLELYISPNVYNTTSLTDGSFAFNLVTNIDEEGQLPSGYNITNNFPNPFNPSTRLGITLPVDGNVSVIIYNILGQKVSEGIKEYFSAGTHFLDIELYGLASGLYIAHISIDEKYSVNKKMMLVYGSQHLTSSGGTFNLPLNKPDLKKSGLAASIDSLVATSGIIGRKTFTNLPDLSGDTTYLGDLSIQRFCPGIPTITYVDKTYNTVLIGSQCWLKENLDVGTMIQGSQNQSNNGVIEKYCYDNDPNNCNIYGGLYQWNEAMQYSTTPGTQGICPPGWHIPTLAEFQTLRSTVGFNGNALKAFGQGIGGGAGTNTSGFSALLAGIRHNFDGFKMLGNSTIIWSSTEYNSTFAYNLYLHSINSVIDLHGLNNAHAFSVRCLKDEATAPGPCPGIPTVTYAGKTYNTVLIGSQCWLKENLDVGTMIQGSQNQTNNGVIEKYCYDNNPNNCNTYGGLYQWNEAMQYSTTPGVQGICPDGWHIPTDDEWCTLTKFIDPTVNCNAIGWSGTDCGTKMKSIAGWSGGGNGTNTSGFTALAGGHRDNIGNFVNKNSHAGYWSSSQQLASDSWFRNLYFGLTTIDRNAVVKVDGRSIRCVKD